MEEKPAAENDALTVRVVDSLAKSRAHVSRLQRTSLRLTVTSFTFSAASTLIAGLTAANGPVVGSGPAGWRLACAAAAGLGFVATALTALVQQMKLGDKRAEALQCVGRLRALEAALGLGTRPRNEVAADYEEVMRLFPDVFA